MPKEEEFDYSSLGDALGEEDRGGLPDNGPSSAGALSSISGAVSGALKKRKQAERKQADEANSEAVNHRAEAAKSLVRKAGATE